MPFQLSLELEVGDLQVNVVVVKLVQDVEWRVVADIIFIRIQCSGCVEGVGVRVDVEIPPHFSAERIHR